MSYECLTILPTIKQIFSKFCMRAMSLEVTGYLPILELINIVTKPRPWSRVEANSYASSKFPHHFGTQRFIMAFTRDSLVFLIL
jgi:hypothetical protein